MVIENEGKINLFLMKTRQNMGKIHGGLAEKGVTLSVHPPASSRQSDAAECGFHCSDGTFRLRAATLRGQNDHIEGSEWPLRGAEMTTWKAKALPKGREALMFASASRFLTVQDDGFQRVRTDGKRFVP